MTKCQYLMVSEQFLLKIQLLIISVVLMKGQSDFVTSYMGPCWAWVLGGAKRKPCAISLNFSTAVQSKVYS